MTAGERMVWAAEFVLALRDDVHSSVAARRAASAVRALRDNGTGGHHGDARNASRHARRRSSQVTAKLDRSLASRMVLVPRDYDHWEIASQLEAALTEIDRLTAETELRGKTVADLAWELGTTKGKMDRMRPVVDAAERWTDDGKVSDETMMDAVRAYRIARSG